MKSQASEDIKDSAIAYFFDYADAILTHSNEFLERNLTIVESMISKFLDLSGDESFLFKKCSSHLKRIIRTLMDKNVKPYAPGFDRLLYRMFRTTYAYWLAQPDPALWLAGARPGEAFDESAYAKLVEPLSHQRFRKLLFDLEALKLHEGHKVRRHIQDYLTMPDYFQILGQLYACGRRPG